VTSERDGAEAAEAALDRCHEALAEVAAVR
jgi:hypothetical protein